MTLLEPSKSVASETPPESGIQGGLEGLRQSVGQDQLQSLLGNYSNMPSEERKEALKQVKTALIGAGVTALAAYILSDEKKDEKPHEAEQPPSSVKDSEEESEEEEDESESTEEPEDEPVKDDEVRPYRPGTMEPHVSVKSAFAAQVKEIYAQQETIYTVNNLNEHFGRNYTKFIIDRDPVSHEQPITFLGKPIRGGINLMMLPFLKIAERNLMNQGLNYVPKQEQVLGFQDRNMCIGDGKGGYMDDPNIPSFHKYGLAIDLDHDTNWPKHGRGDIPDEVILAMAEAGFACGNVADPSFYYLMNDTMHYQMRFPPDSVAGQRIINASPIGKRYWEAIRPELEGLKRTS